MSCSCNGGYVAAVQPTMVASISPCACQGAASRVAPVAASFNVSPMVTRGTVVIPRLCTSSMVAPVAASMVAVKRGCGCRG